MQLTKSDIDEMALIIHKSNALVGAAPEMLGLLKRLRDRLDCTCQFCHGINGHHSKTCTLAALIARAEGGTPTPGGCGESR
jgi:hypothetical protein